MRWTRLFLVVFAAVFFPRILLPQTDNCSRRILPVSVVTPDGTAVSGLQSTNFRASLRGTPVQIVSAELSDKPPRIVLLIDASASMSWDPQIWGLYLRMAEHLLASLPPNVPVALEVFASHIVRTIPPTLDREKMRAELKSLEYFNEITTSKDKHTSMWEALQAAPRLLGTPAFGDVVFALTDAANNYGKTSIRDAVESIRSSEVRVFWFFVEVPPGHTPEEVVGLHDFEDLVSDTGGIEVNFLPSRLNRGYPFVDGNGQNTEAGLRLQKQYNLMLNIYRLEIGFPTPLQKGARWKLDAAVPNGPKLEVLYPPKLSDCAVLNANR